MVSTSKLKRPPAASPTKNLVLLSDGLFPCTKNPLLVPVIPVGLGLPADILIDENGIVEKAFYGSHTASHIPLNEVVLFSKS